MALYRCSSGGGYRVIYTTSAENKTFEQKLTEIEPYYNALSNDDKLYTDIISVDLNRKYSGTGAGQFVGYGSTSDTRIRIDVIRIADHKYKTYEVNGNGTVLADESSVYTTEKLALVVKK